MPDSPERPAPETAAQALARARRHARRAVGEALAACQALVDAASIAWSGAPGEARTALHTLSRLLDEQSRAFRDGEGSVPMPVMTALLDALDQEIARWEKRADRDPDARAVLRTFLGLREILWEFGFRRDAAEASAGQEGSRGQRSRKSSRKRSATPKAGGGAPKRRRRVQRVDVQG